MDVNVRGRLHFDPPNHTKKHIKQSEWKRIAMILFDDELDAYYRWFLLKRFSLKLQAPLRGPHITFINDRISDIPDLETKWTAVSKKYEGQIIKLKLNLDVRTNGKHWWLNVPEDSRKQIHEIRAELGLGRPYFGLHMTIGYASERNIPHSEYIHRFLISNND